MHVEVAETGPCSRTITVQVPPESVQEHLDQLYASASQQVRMKGFRPGKVPRKFLEKHMSGDVLAQAKEQIVNRYLSEACRERQIAPVGRVLVDEYEQLEVRPGAPLQFTAKLDVRPSFELGETKGLEAPGFESEATTEDVDRALEQIANEKRSIHAVQEPAQDGDFVKVDLAFLDQEGNQVHERKNVQLNTRIPIAGSDPAAFAAALTGAEAGKSVELDLTFPANFEKEAVRGQPGKARLSVHEVLRVTPAPIDDELAKSLEFESLEALRQDLLTRIGQEKVRVGKQRQEEACLMALIQQTPFELPPSLVDEQQMASLQTYAQRLEQNGMGKEEIEQKVTEAKDEARQDAERRVRLFFLIEAIAKQQKLFVTEGDVEAEIRALAHAHSATPAQIREHLEQNRQVGELRLGILERKVREFLRENAKIVDRKG